MYSPLGRRSVDTIIWFCQYTGDACGSASQLPLRRLRIRTMAIGQTRSWYPPRGYCRSRPCLAVTSGTHIRRTVALTTFLERFQKPPWVRPKRCFTAVTAVSSWSTPSYISIPIWGLWQICRGIGRKPIRSSVRCWASSGQSKIIAYKTRLRQNDGARRSANSAGTGSRQTLNADAPFRLLTWKQVGYPRRRMKKSDPTPVLPVSEAMVCYPRRVASA